MSELPGQQTAAFARLSAQFEREQRQHREQVEALRRRIERQDAESETLRRRFERQAAQVEALHQRVEWLSGQVTHLAQDYRTLAATLRELWS